MQTGLEQSQQHHDRSTDTHMDHPPQYAPPVQPLSRNKQPYHVNAGHQDRRQTNAAGPSPIQSQIYYGPPAEHQRPSFQDSQQQNGILQPNASSSAHLGSSFAYHDQALQPLDVPGHALQNNGPFDYHGQTNGTGYGALPTHPAQPVHSPFLEYPPEPAAQIWHGTNAGLHPPDDFASLFQAQNEHVGYHDGSLPLDGTSLFQPSTPDPLRSSSPGIPDFPEDFFTMFDQDVPQQQQQQLPPQTAQPSLMDLLVSGPPTQDQDIPRLQQQLPPQAAQPSLMDLLVSEPLTQDQDVLPLQQQLPPQAAQPSLMDLLGSRPHMQDLPQGRGPPRISSPAFPDDFLHGFDDMVPSSGPQQRGDFLQGPDVMHAGLDLLQPQGNAQMLQNGIGSVSYGMQAPPAGHASRQAGIGAVSLDAMDIDTLANGGRQMHLHQAPTAVQPSRAESPDILDDFFASHDNDALPRAELLGGSSARAPPRADSPDIMNTFFSSFHLDDLDL